MGIERVAMAMYGVPDIRLFYESDARFLAQELAELLTRQGVKVEAILRPWDGLSGVVVARVIDVRDHPDSDKLCLARVDHGAGQREVVVGVRNMRPGDLVPLAG